MKWEMSKRSNKPIPRYWHIERDSWRYSLADDKYIFHGTTMPYTGVKSKREAKKQLDRIEADAKARIGGEYGKNGEYVMRTSADDLKVCIYGNRFHFKIEGR